MCVVFFSYVEFETFDKALIQFKEEHPLIHRNPETNGFLGISQMKHVTPIKYKDINLLKNK